MIILIILLILSIWTIGGIFVFKKYNKILIENRYYATKYHASLMVASGPIVWVLYFLYWSQEQVR